MNALDSLLVAVPVQSKQDTFDCVSRILYQCWMCRKIYLVTGSIHCMITPDWCNQLNKEELVH